MKYTGIMNLNLQQVQAFLAVAECNSMTRAAECMNVTQPLISQRLNALESSLGIQLFVRVKNQLKITSAGSYLYKEWANLTDSMEKAVEEAHRISRNENNMIKVGFPFSMSETHLLRFAPQLSNIAPEISVQIENSNSLKQHLLNRDVDVIYRTQYEPMDDSDEIQYFIIKIKRFITIMHNSYPLAKKNRLEWRDLENTTIFCQPPSKTGYYEQQLSHICKKNGFSPRIVTCTNLFNAELNMTLGKGVVVGVQHSVDLSSGDFTWFEMDELEAPIVMACLKDSDTKIIDFTRQAADIIRSYI
ncbi:LysR family transcriptional regulator [Lachnospiraceae bacterium 62-35]